MLFKSSLGFLCAISFAFLSCNSNEQANSGNSSTEADGTLLQTPADFFASREKTDAYFISCEKILKQDSLNIQLRTELAAHYYAAKEFSKAIHHFLKVYEIDNKNLTALISLGNIYYDIEQNEEAIEFYEKAMAIDNNNIDMRCDLATCYSRINKIEKAIQILKENVKVHYKHEKSHHNLSVILRQSGRIDEADEEMRIFNQLTAVKTPAGS